MAMLTQVRIWLSISSLVAEHTKHVKRASVISLQRDTVNMEKLELMNFSMHSTLTLRPYQNNLVEGVLAAINHGDNSTLVISPTGSGKTVCFIKICERLIDQCADDEVVLILSHLSLLTDQTKKKFNRFSSLPVGILQGQKLPEPTDRVIVSTMQSSRMFEKIVHYYDTSGKRIRYIVIDESHMRFSASYQEILRTFPKAQVIDFTATPFKDRKLATSSYDSISFQISLMELIEQKYLVPPILKQILLESDSSAKKCAMMLRTYQEYELGKKAIMFMANKEECKLLSDALVQEGIKAAVITDAVTGKKRDAIFEGYDNDLYDVLISVNVLTAGFDSLLCECVFMFGTESPTVYLQRVGRALRPVDGDSVKPFHSKRDARIYVFGDTPTIESGVIERHHNQAIKPKKYSDCETLADQIEWLEDNGQTETPEYKFNKAAEKIQRIAKKINMDTLGRMIESKSISAEFMLKLAAGVDNFKAIQGGDRIASKDQILKVLGAGVKDVQGMTSNEANLIITSLTGVSMNHHGSQQFVVKQGKYAGSHVKDLPWAYKSICVKKFPSSEIAQLVNAYHKLAKPKHPYKTKVTTNT